MLVLLGAMREEISDLRKQMIIEETYTHRDCRIYKGKYGIKDILLAQTGIGKDKAETTANFILEHYSVTAFICLGFAAALVERLKVGDVILCTTLYCEERPTSGEPKLQSPFYSDINLVSLALKTQENSVSGVHQASSVTVASPICKPDEKLVLGKAFSAETADMESYWIARIASARQIPFLSIRAISDTADDRLPSIDRFLNPDKWQLMMTTLYFLTHPQQLIKLFYLYRNARRARKSLTTFMDSLIAEL